MVNADELNEKKIYEQKIKDTLKDMIKQRFIDKFKDKENVQEITKAALFTIKDLSTIVD